MAKWALPGAGDIVWCVFPELPDLTPGRKPRPALVVTVENRADGDIVTLAYGTSKHLDRLKAGEFAITKAKHQTAYALAGLVCDTKFDFKLIVDLPWGERYFKVPLRNTHGNTPKIGTLHATVQRAAATAYQAAMSR